VELGLIEGFSTNLENPCLLEFSETCIDPGEF
jgi:hypothetical protein